MSVKIKFAKALPKKTDALIVGISSDLKFCDVLKGLDKKSGGLIKHAIKADTSFKGKSGNILSIMMPEGAEVPRVILFGLGDLKELTVALAEDAGGNLFAKVGKVGLKSAALCLCCLNASKNISAEKFAAHVCLGLKMRSYVFDRYKTKTEATEGEDSLEAIESITVIGNSHGEISNIYKMLDNMVQGVFTARDLVNEPPNILQPDYFAKFIKKELSSLGVKVTIFDEKKMKTLGMKAALAVGQGSESPPRIVVMEWNGGKKGNPAVALVGKGVTFDTGGISLKPGAGMDEMKMDMGGAAAVVGTMRALAANKINSNVIGIVGLVENMPSGKAYRPGDIIGSYAGKTIEVLNTDAEGRLVLADALAYVQDTYKPVRVIDLATLTGAMMVALGHEYCGVFCNDKEFWDNLESSAEGANEKVWRMPLDKAYKKSMESDVADVRNMSKMGRLAGSCTAAGFLEHFIKDGTKWAHMDIAGTAWIKTDKSVTPKFGTGFGVRLLTQFIADHHSA